MISFLTRYYSTPVEEAISFINDIEIERIIYHDLESFTLCLREVSNEILMVNPSIHFLRVLQLIPNKCFLYFTQPMTSEILEVFSKNDHLNLLLWNKEDKQYCSDYGVKSFLLYPITSDDSFKKETCVNLSVFNRLKSISYKDIEIFNSFNDVRVYQGLKTLTEEDDYQKLVILLKTCRTASVPVFDTLFNVYKPSTVFDFAKSIPVISLFRLLNERPSFIYSDTYFSCIPSFFQNIENAIGEYSDQLIKSKEFIQNYFKDHKNIKEIIK